MASPPALLIGGGGPVGAASPPAVPELEEVDEGIGFISPLPSPFPFSFPFSFPFPFSFSFPFSFPFFQSLPFLPPAPHVMFPAGGVVPID